MAAEFQALMAEALDGSTAERAATAFQWDTFRRQCAAMDHRIVASHLPAAELGEPSVAAALSTLLRISSAEANPRVNDAAVLGPRSAMTGEPLDPVLTDTAAAQRRGDIGAEHVTIIGRFFKQLPGFVDHDTRQAAEHQLAELACGLRPEELRKAADRLAMMLDQDGELSDTDRRKRSWIRVGQQRRDGTASQAVAAKLAAPGMCNPDVDTPRVDDQPTDDHRRTDTRSTGQRHHDAFKAVLRAILASGQLSSHKGVPVTMIVSTTL